MIAVAFSDILGFGLRFGCCGLSLGLEGHGFGLGVGLKGCGLDAISCLPDKFVSEMTYTVSSGTLNSTIPYHAG